MYISDHRFKVLHEKHSIEWFLVIKAVTYKDQGVYECQVNSDPYKTFKYHLSVVGEYLCNQGAWLFIMVENLCFLFIAVIKTLHIITK